ncbi:glycosyltransferase family 2 protein [Winogradskyella sp. A2]|uniref:glycosyltransferase family 2 protein n=1 Tax=Winogradskyella sp. A2 TaxID=3366944 RepID=UPI00398C613B
MKLSVIILNYNVKYFLELCLKSVEKAIRTIDGEIIVVDNASNDDSCEMVRSKFPKVKLIENHDNLGFSKGNNIGVAMAKGEYLCILNPDTVVAEDTFIELIEFYAQTKNTGIVGCQLIDGKGNYLPESKRNIPTPIISLKKMLGMDKSYYANYLDKDEVGIVDVFVGAFMFLKSKTYNEVGGFDEDYFMYGEDIDLSYKIKKAGYTNYYYGKTSLVHFKGESTMKNSVYAKRFHNAMQIFYKKHFKSNVIFNAVVWLGIKVLQLTKNTKEDKVPLIESTYVFTEKLDNSVAEKLNQPIHSYLDLKTQLSQNSMLVYDCDIIDFKTIISDMKQKSKQVNCVFRFLLKSSNFIIGSDSSSSRGVVEKF